MPCRLGIVTYRAGGTYRRNPPRVLSSLGCWKAAIHFQTVSNIACKKKTAPTIGAVRFFHTKIMHSDNLSIHRRFVFGSVQVFWLANRHKSSPSHAYIKRNGCAYAREPCSSLTAAGPCRNHTCFPLSCLRTMRTGKTPPLLTLQRIYSITKFDLLSRIRSKK